MEHTGVVCRYADPFFRTLSVGEPACSLRKHSSVTCDMLAALIDILRPGISSNEANAAKSGCADSSVLKRSGYSVGLNFPRDWGEDVSLDLYTGDYTVLQAGMVFHLPQTMGVGHHAPSAISETVLITDTGCTVLTSFSPRELIVVE